MAGREDTDDIASVIDAALSFVAGHDVDEVVSLGDEIFDERIEDKLYAQTIALTRKHLRAGQRVWLVSAAPVEMASLIARKLELTGALGTVSEIVDGEVHRQARRRSAARTGQGRGRPGARRARGPRPRLCAAYSDSSNDIPMLSLVGQPVAINPDAALRRHARAMGWHVHDYRTGRKAATHRRARQRSSSALRPASRPGSSPAAATARPDPIDVSLAARHSGGDLTQLMGLGQKKTLRRCISSL